MNVTFIFACAAMPRLEPPARRMWPPPALLLLATAGVFLLCIPPVAANYNHNSVAAAMAELKKLYPKHEWDIEARCCLQRLLCRLFHVKPWRCAFAKRVYETQKAIVWIFSTRSHCAACLTPRICKHGTNSLAACGCGHPWHPLCSPLPPH